MQEENVKEEEEGKQMNDDKSMMDEEEGDEGTTNHECPKDKYVHYLLRVSNSLSTGLFINPGW